MGVLMILNNVYLLCKFFVTPTGDTVNTDQGYPRYNKPQIHTFFEPGRGTTVFVEQIVLR